MKILVIGDMHIGARSDSLIFNEYFISYFEDMIFDYLKDEKIKTIIQLGDIFDRRKFVNFQILDQWKKRVFEILKDRKIDFYLLLGNHDVYYKNTNEINSPSLLLGEFENIKVIQEPTEIAFGSKKVLMVPWINSSNYDASVKRISESSAQFVFGHFDIQGFEMYKGHTSLEGFDSSTFSKFKAVYTGHYHTKSSKGNIHYLGIPYEITWMDYGDPKGIHIWNTVTESLTFHQNPFSIFHKIYYDDSKQQGPIDFEDYRGSYVKVVIVNKTNIYLFDKFMTELYSVSPQDVKIIEASIDYDTEEEEEIEYEDTRTIMKSYVNSLELSDDKDKILMMLDELYVEALQVIEE